MQYGKRIIYDIETGNVLNGTFGEMEGDLVENLRPKKIDFVDLPFGDKTLKNALKYHINTQTKEIVIDEYEKIERTKDEQIQELENKLLIEKEKELGGLI